MIPVYDLSQNNSLLNQFVAEIRDINIHSDRLRFRRNIERIGEVIAYEISKTLTYKSQEVQTPLGVKTCSIPDSQVVLCTILRAGLPFHQGFLNYFDHADNAFVSAARVYNDDHSEFRIDVSYLSAPSIEGKTVIIVDPMLATAGSLELAYKALLQRGTPAAVYIACAIASQKGVENTCKFLPEQNSSIWAAAIDPSLNEKAYIVPGLGDAGDLAYGEKI